jgi:hypothetical protein
VILREGAVAAMLTLKARVACCADESATPTVKENVPAVVGMPARAPVDELRAKPGGREPEARLQEYGAVPPVAVRAAPYVDWTVPDGRLLVLIPSGDAVEPTLMLSAWAADSAGREESCTPTVNEKDPTLVGVPVKVPADELSVTPGGNAPDATLHVYGVFPPEALRVASYKVLSVPLAKLVVIILRLVAWSAFLTLILSGRESALIGGVVSAVTRTLKLNSPVAWGVPEMRPVLSESETPGGRVPEAMLHVSGAPPPTAVNWVA